MGAEPASSRVIIIGPLPPPMNGAAKNTGRIGTDLAAAGVEIVRLTTSTTVGSSHSRTYAYHRARAFQTVRNASNLLKDLRVDDRIYIVPDGGLGIWYNLVYCIIIALQGSGVVWMHHRSYPNMVRRDFALSLIVRMLHRRLGHVFLDDEMAHQFTLNYGVPVRQSYIIRNAATCDVKVSSQRLLEQRSDICVGFLSNLNFDKGFDIAVAVFKVVALVRPDIVFSVGGEPSDAEAKALLADLRSALGSRLSYHGHVEGDAKQSFFEGIDVFVFPTTYHFEAQPNVIYEAMAAGASVVSTVHACIPYMFEQASHRLVALGEREKMVKDTIDAVLTEIDVLSTAEGRFSSRCNSQDEFSRIQSDARKAYQRFITFELAGKS